MDEIGLDEIGGWVRSGRQSGGRIIFGFATVGLRFARRRFAALDLLKWEEMGLGTLYRRITKRKKMREMMSLMVKKFAKMKSFRDNRLRDLRVSLDLGLCDENGRSEWAQLPPPLLLLKAIFDWTRWSNQTVFFFFSFWYVYVCVCVCVFVLVMFLMFLGDLWFGIYEKWRIRREERGDHLTCSYSYSGEVFPFFLSCFIINFFFFFSKSRVSQQIKQNQNQFFFFFKFKLQCLRERNRPPDDRFFSGLWSPM